MFSLSYLFLNKKNTGGHPFLKGVNDEKLIVHADKYPKKQCDFNSFGNYHSLNNQLENVKITC